MVSGACWGLYLFVRARIRRERERGGEELFSCASPSDEYLFAASRLTAVCLYTCAHRLDRAWIGRFAGCALQVLYVEDLEEVWASAGSLSPSCAAWSGFAVAVFKLKHEDGERKKAGRQGGRGKKNTWGADVDLLYVPKHAWVVH